MERKRVINRFQEYPGSTTWEEYEILCPDCQKWCKDYGTTDTLIDNEWVPLCITCGDKIEFPLVLEKNHINP